MRFAVALIAFACPMLGQLPVEVSPHGEAVTSDCAADGVAVNAVTGEPIARAHITVTGPKGQNISSADNAGHWSISNISCGRIQIMANRPGYLPAVLSKPLGGKPYVPLELAAGSSAHDLKIQMTPQSVVVGHVVDDEGDPVQNAQVVAMVSRVIQGQRVFQATVTGSSNDLGEFRLAALPAARYVFCARGSPILVYTPTPNNSTVSGESCYPGPVEGGAASAMQVPAGHESRIDFTLPRVSAVHIRGVITGMPPSARAGLTLVRKGASAVRGNLPSLAAVRVDGKFEFSAVAPGSYLLTADYFEAGKRLMARVPVEVGSSDIEGLSVHLETGFSLSGSVRFESATGAAPPTVAFNLHPTDPTIGGGTPQWNKERTAFTMADMPPGTYTLDAGLSPPFYVKNAMVGGRDVWREPIQLSQAGAPLDIVVADNGGTMEGQVSDADSRPTAAVVMVLQGSRAPRIAAAGPSGHFTLAGLAPGDYQVYAWDDMENVEYANPEWLRHYSGAAVSVQAGQTSQVKLIQAVVQAR